jgi:hypothetical protein
VTVTVLVTTAPAPLEVTLVGELVPVDVNVAATPVLPLGRGTPLLIAP